MLLETLLSLTLVVCCWFPCKPAPHGAKPTPQYVPVVQAPVIQAPVVQAPIVVHPPIIIHPVVETPKKEAPKEKSLYERLGGEAAIKAVVDDFVARTAANPKVNFTRKGTPNEWKPTPDGLDHLKKMLVDFVGSATGGPQKYTGKSMKDAHKGMMITADEFAAIAGDLKATLDKFKVPAKEQDELMKAVGGTAKDIIEAPKGK